MHVGADMVLDCNGELVTEKCSQEDGGCWPKWSDSLSVTRPIDVCLTEHSRG
jgi:hypothetical protein